MARQKAKSTRPRSKAEILDLIIAVVGVSEDPPTSLQLWDALRGHLSLGRDRFMSLLWELHEQGILQAFDPEDASARSRKPVSSEARLRTDLEWEARVGLKECAAVEEKAERIASSMTRVPKAEQILERQTEILQLIADGLGTKQVARELGITHKTVHNHLNAIYRRLDTQSLTHAVLSAVRKGIIHLDPADD